MGVDRMTEKQCYSCKYYAFEMIKEYFTLKDDWCSKDNKYFMRKNIDCPNYEVNE